MEGNPTSQLVKLIRKISDRGGEGIEYATVISPPPDIRIRIDNVPIDFDADDLIIPEHLLAHDRTASINGGESVTITFNSVLQPDTRIIVSSMNNGQKYAVIGKVKG